MKLGKNSLTVKSQAPFRMRNVVVVVMKAVSGLAVGETPS
jgi:hypothetical protein